MDYTNVISILNDITVRTSNRGPSPDMTYKTIRQESTDFILDLNILPTTFGTTAPKPITHFELPFNPVTLIFETPPMIEWMKNQNTQTFDKLPFLAISIKQGPLPPKYNISKLKLTDPRWYCVNVLILEDIKTAQDNIHLKNTTTDYKDNDKIPEGLTEVASLQWFTFVAGKNGEGILEPHLDMHFPCMNTRQCRVPTIPKQKQVLKSRKNPCRQAQVALRLVEIIIHTVNQLTPENRTVVHSIPTKVRQTLGIHKYRKRGRPLSNVIYKYDPKDLRLGQGTPHGYRYPVRRHPRVVNDRVIWVKSHIRGKGELKKKEYYENPPITIQMADLFIQNITRIRIIERIYVMYLRNKKTLANHKKV